MLALFALAVVINGKPVSDAELQALLASAPAQLRTATPPEEQRRYYGFIDRLAAMAEADGLAAQSPTREALAVSRKMVLAQARMDQFYKGLSIPQEELQAWYNAHRADYQEARAKLLRAPTNQGDLITLRRKDGAIPAAVRDAVFALKPGQSTAPIVLPNGTWVLRLEAIAAMPFEQARGEIYNTIADSRFQQWVAGIRAGVTVAP